MQFVMRYVDTYGFKIPGVSIERNVEPLTIEETLGAAFWPPKEGGEWLDDCDLLGAMALLGDFRWNSELGDYFAVVFGLKIRSDSAGYFFPGRELEVVGIEDEDAFTKFLRDKGIVDQFDEESW